MCKFDEISCYKFHYSEKHDSGDSVDIYGIPEISIESITNGKNPVFVNIQMFSDLMLNLMVVFYIFESIMRKPIM